MRAAPSPPCDDSLPLLRRHSPQGRKRLLSPSELLKRQVPPQDFANLPRRGYKAPMDAHRLCVAPMMDWT
jgi:hypothetical protein